jgi:hypothetical protein
MPTIKVKIDGLEEMARSLRALPQDAQAEMKREAKDIATSLADWMKADARGHSRQAAKASRSVREAAQGFWPMVTASNSSKLLWGSIFGMKQHSGWYRHKRYRSAKGQQFKGGYIGYPGYWFFSSAERRMDWVSSEWGKAAEEIARKVGG